MSHTNPPNPPQSGPDQLREQLRELFGKAAFGEELSGLTNEAMSLIAASHNNLIDSFEREVIGEDEPDMGNSRPTTVVPARNRLRQEQRERLPQLLNKHRRQQ